MKPKRFASLLALLPALLLTACGVNPVSGKTEIQLISAAQEVKIGEQNYAPSRQSQGGDLKVLPELSAYVSTVGQKLAAVSDRPLPYEFVVLNSSVPNAWALPGGKIAVNRGLLTALENEAELAAVLGHEIVHAAARHGAKAQERGIALQAGMLATQIGLATSNVDQNLGSLLVQGASVGAQLVSLRYGRDAELEADLYGMQYMQRAGYDPAAAITLQQKFLQLAEADGRTRQSWLEGLFASHPPSAERVERNRQTAAGIGTTAGAARGELGTERYQAQLKPLLALKPAYDKADEATAAAAKKDLPRARALAAEAARMLPREARFHQLQGDLALAAKDLPQAMGHYEKSLALDTEYFGAYLGGGVTAYRQGNRQRAEEWLTQSAKLLPTAPALYYLGAMAKDAGRTEQALEYFKGAAGSQSDIGKQAAAEYTLLDLPRNPGNYVAAGAQQDARGALVVVLENRAPVALTEITFTPVLLDAAGQIAQQARSVRLARTLAPGERTSVDAGVGPVAGEVLPRVRIRIDRAVPASP